MASSLHTIRSNACLILAMHTTRCQWHVSHAMHASSHAHPRAMHIPLPCMPVCHACPCHTCSLTYMPPTMHAPMSCMPSSGSQWLGKGGGEKHEIYASHLWPLCFFMTYFRMAPSPPGSTACACLLQHMPPAMHTPSATHATPLDRMTDACKNIIFPHLLLRAVTKWGRVNGGLLGGQHHLLLISQHNSLSNLLCTIAICMNTTQTFVPQCNDIREITPLSSNEPREDSVRLERQMSQVLSSLELTLFC